LRHAFLTPLYVNSVMHQKATLHHAVPSRSSGFFALHCSPHTRRNARRNALFAGARAMQRPDVALSLRPSWRPPGGAGRRHQGNIPSPVPGSTD
jgi:hypothetical protein